ncbi:DNA-binding IclR family transcriptional regulator [Agromyces terreus]|uniref:DNA-binding IclR family transcriptional regulator n=2 Tax=Agromyces terreus TaxID=424795 RepID=A0A9X2H344_9MICO|nr:DNA-binding IclR family transcriptional regulator [Agromyces terreus]
MSTTHALLADLERNELVERLPDRTFRLGVRLWELASRTPGVLGLRELALPHLVDLHAEVGQHVQLGVLNGGDAVFLERLSSRDAVVNVTVVGGRLPAHASAVGLVLVAFADTAVQDAVLAGPLERFTDRTIVDPAALRRTLHEVRTTGFALGNGYVHADARGLAVPITGAAGEVVAALGVVVPNDDAPWEPLRERLRRTADAIAVDLRRASLPQSDPEASPGGRYRALVHSSDESMAYLAKTRPTPRARG